MDKFQRSYKLTVDTDAVEIGNASNPAASALPSTHQIQIANPFTVEFDVNRSVLSSANTSSFKLYNLNKNTRSQIYKDKYTTNLYQGVEFKAGYQGLTPTIFKGNVKQCYSVREGVNFVTTLEAYDGGFAFINGQTSTNFPAGTPQNAVLESILKDLPRVNRGAVGTFTGSLTRGNSISGNTADLLKELSGNAFFVDLEKAYVLQDDEAILGPISVLTSSTGLLGTPRREENVLTVDMIFEPRLLIGQQILLNTSTGEGGFNGLFKVISLHHKGMISDAICGSATTTAGLWFGTKVLKIVGSA